MAQSLIAEHKRGLRYAWPFLIPGIALLVVFIIIPFFSAFYYSLTNMRLMSPLPVRMVGIDNYTRLFEDSLFWTALRNNFLFVIVVVPVQTVFALGLAMLVNQPLKGTKVFRTIYFVPTVTSMVVVAVIWAFLYHPEGLINMILSSMTFGRWQPLDFLNNPQWAFPAIMVLSIWQGAGFQMLIYLAGLQNIPQSLYEASYIDGANRWKQFLYITLPQLKNTTTFVVISTTILAFKLFDQIQILTRGGPRNSTYTMVLYIYNQGFTRRNIGYASAITVIFFLIVLGISILQRFVLKEDREVA